MAELPSFPSNKLDNLQTENVSQGRYNTVSLVNCKYVNKVLDNVNWNPGDRQCKLGHGYCKFDTCRQNVNLVKLNTSVQYDALTHPTARYLMINK